MRKFALLMLALLLPLTASAGDTWTTPFTGVRRLHRTTSSPLWNINVLVVDLNNPAVSLDATTQALFKKKTSAYGTAASAQAAINANFYNTSNWVPIGLAAGNGVSWHGDDTWSGNLAVGTGRAEIYEEAPVTAFDSSWMRGAVSGRPIILKNGVVPTGMTDPSHCSSRNPRTAVGLSQDKKTLYLFVVDGRQASLSVGMTCTELGNAIKNVGAYNALNLDGGGSTTMWMSGTGVVNSPSDGSERTVSNHLGVFVASAQQTGIYTGVVYEAPDTARRIAGATVNVQGTAQTATTGSNGAFSFNLAPGSYTVVANAPGYQQNSSTRTVTAGATIWGSIGLQKSAPADTDGDGVADASDNCPSAANPDQKDTDGDAAGDACDSDDDGDGVADASDNCALLANANQADLDSDGKGDACDPDDDGDAVPDGADNCPLVANGNQVDADHDGVGDACDDEVDSDGDGVDDGNDNCPQGANPDQADVDGDGQGDSCDEDNDNDGVADGLDNCPLVSNADQADADDDGKGDLCDDDPPADVDAGLPPEADAGVGAEADAGSQAQTDAGLVEDSEGPVAVEGCAGCQNAGASATFPLLGALVFGLCRRRRS